MSKLMFNNEISIVISGSAGQGLQTLEQLIMNVMKFSGYHVFAYSEFMSRIRGGNNSTEIRISSERVKSFIDRIDIFVGMDANAMHRLKDRISPETLIIGKEEHIEKSYKNRNNNILYIPSEKSSNPKSDKIIMNTLILGIISALMDIDRSNIINFLKEFFHNLNNEKIGSNIFSLEKGYKIFNENLKSQITYPLFSPPSGYNKEPLLYGSDAIGIGALAGGCNFVSSYPMSPSTNVLTFLADKAEEFKIVVEQTEDEISAINMALGSWYAGGKAMVTTSGGGFALMVEGLSLGGAIESPIVIHIGQRPGPATGLPTRTEQGDLLFALYSGHGEFPRAILAPGTKKQGITLTCHAFNIADKYQMPVFILTDQYFIDSAYNDTEIDITSLKEEKYFVATDILYKRYSINKESVSPRGIPGFGRGIVCVDSDEHDEYGHITEDFKMRTEMVNKRLKKLDYMAGDVIPPEHFGSEDYKYLVVSWGSTLEAVKESGKVIQSDELAFLHFSQVYPLHEKTISYLKKAKKTAIIENNATSQFGKIIRSYTGHQFDDAILKYNGMPFSVEELVRGIKQFIG